MFISVQHSFMVKMVIFITHQYLYEWVFVCVLGNSHVDLYHIIYHICYPIGWYLNRTLLIFMYLDTRQNNWSSTALFMKSHNVCSVPHISSFLIWHTWHNWTNVILSYGVYPFPHEFIFLIWRMRCMYHDTYHSQFNNISCRYHT